MEMPRLDGHEVLELQDRGGCGRVYRVVGTAGELRALKVFEPLAVNRAILAKMDQRLQVDGWPDGVMPWDLRQLEHPPLHVVMPWVAEDLGGGRFQPRSLQHHWGKLGRAEAWRLIRSVAEALAQMHGRHVPHGNLKPGNVFLRPGGGVWLSDWALGNMPGVHVFQFTDALLYQPPEQLLDTTGYLDEQGYGWDVYAFGVLAYRLLAGRFPRCDAAFSKVAPAVGVTRCEGLQADPAKLARNLRAEAVAGWPEPPADEVERRMREWIVRCLDIDPAHRPVSMAEVIAGFESIEAGVARERRERRGRRVVAGLLAAVCVLLVVVAGLAVGMRDHAARRVVAEQALRDFERRMEAERSELAAALAAAERARDEAQQAEDEAKRGISGDREAWLEQLEASRMVGDQLFGWAMETGRRRLPPLDDRKLRLQRLEGYFLTFLKSTEGQSGLAAERARVRLQLAEVAISEGNVALAVSRMDEALKAWQDLPKGAELMLRLATDRLLVAILRDERSDPLARGAYRDAREALAAVPRDRVDADRLDQLMAVLEFHEAKLLAAAGDERRALEQLMRATQTLNRIAGRRPEVAILRSALADCYLSSANILEGLGSMGDAREVRMLACAELERLYKGKPDDLTVQLELAACYGAMAEAAILSGDMEEAERRSREGLAILNLYLSGRPRDDEALDRKASLLGLRAGIRRDRGEVAEAMQLYDEAMKMLEAIHDRRPEHALASYHLALICWQQGRMLAAQDGGNDLARMRRASQLLADLAKHPRDDGPRPEQLKRSQAYLAGDLGHALQAKQQADQAKAALKEAIERWQELVVMRPHNEEYRQGLDWCRERLAQLP